jgi:hypothetical protein
MDKSSPTCARHPDGTRSELWRSLSYQVGDEHANRITRGIDLYCRLVRLSVERLRSHVPGAAPAGPTPQKVVPIKYQPVARALEELRAVVAAMGGYFVKDTRPCTSSLLATLRDRFTALEDAIDAHTATERREHPMRVVETIGLGRLPDLVPAERWEVAGDAKAAWIHTQEKRLFVLGPLAGAVPALRLVCDLVNEARSVVQGTQVPSKARDVLTPGDVAAMSQIALPWGQMTIVQARENMAHVLLALHTQGVRAAWEAARQGAHGVLPSQRARESLMLKSPAEEKPDTDRGLYEKYRIERTDGTSAPGQKHHGCEHFVLDLDHDPHALAALRAYAMSCAKLFPSLAADLSKKALQLHDRWTNAGATFGVLTDSISIDPEKARAIVGWTHDNKPR